MCLMPWTSQADELAGTLKNQTLPDGSGPATTVDNNGNGGLSYLPGQRTSACTCAGEDHPGPSHDVGRYASEIDIIEAQIVIEQATGQVSQSYQLAPFDAGYQFSNTTAGAYKIHDSSITAFNSYLGGTFQQSASALTMIDDEIYINQNTIDPNSGSGEFRVFGMEYKSKPDDRPNAYIRWISQGKDSWTLWGKGLAANAEGQISERIITEEPMALVFNFGASNNFQNVDFGHLIMPNYVRIDYVRVYQAEGGVVGCDPEDKPTADYIQKHYNAYTNPNLTLWSDAGKWRARIRIGIMLSQTFRLHFPQEQSDRQVLVPYRSTLLRESRPRLRRMEETTDALVALYIEERQEEVEEGLSHIQGT